MRNFLKVSRGRKVKLAEKDHVGESLFSNTACPRVAWNRGGPEGQRLNMERKGK